MRYHLNAQTNFRQREKISQSPDSSRNLAQIYQVSHVTVAKWKKREEFKDAISSPHTIHYAVPKDLWKIIKVVRKKTLLPLDDLVSALINYIPQLNRDNCFRILKHYQLNRLSSREKVERKKFATYKPGFLHVDLFYLPKINNQGVKKRYYCFLAIDRATRMIYLEVYDRKDRFSAADFLIKCLNFYPFFIHTILTDNGLEFTLRDKKNWSGKINAQSLFDIICSMVGIKHKLTKIKHPWTNGMAERAIGIVKEHTTKIHFYPQVSEAVSDIKAFQEYHNHHRRLKTLKGITPIQMAARWFIKEPKIFIKDPITMQLVC